VEAKSLKPWLPWFEKIEELIKEALKGGL